MGRSREQHREYMRAYRARKRAEKAAAVPASEAVAPSSVTPEPSAVRSRSTKHVDAVERMLAETGLGRLDEELPLVEVLRDLAAELDEEPTAGGRRLYLTALRDARRVLAAAPGSAVPARAASEEAETPPPTDDVPPVAAETEPEVADFESFRRAKGGASTG